MTYHVPSTLENDRLKELHSVLTMIQDIITGTISQIRNLDIREVKKLVQGHPTP